ncbi:uncharacterized protein LOC144715897 [Wolffia australiana]
MANPFVRHFQVNNEETLHSSSTQEFELRVNKACVCGRRYDQPTSSKVGVLVIGDRNKGDGRQNIVLRMRGGGLQFVSQLDRKYDPLHFVLLFSYASLRWSLQLKERSKVMMNQFYAFHLMATLHASLYQGLIDQVVVNDVVALVGRMIILPPPPSFTISSHYMQGEALLSGQKAQDQFDLCCRIFWLKLKELLHLIIDKKIFGKVKGRVYVVEFQTRGLPHAHLLWIPDDSYKPKTPEGIDKIICVDFANPRCPCMKDGKCSKNFPKEFISSTQVNNNGYPLYQHCNDGHVVQKGSHLIENRWVIPYNKFLCKVFNCHINVESCSSIRSVKYMYKYVYNGHDCIHA